MFGLIKRIAGVSTKVLRPVLIIILFSNYVSAIEPTKDVVSSEKEPVSESVKEPLKELVKESEKVPLKNEQATTQTPIYFDVLNNELKNEEIVLNYDLKSKGGESLVMGPLEFTKDSFQAEIAGDDLRFKWDRNFVKNGVITLFNLQGEAQWERTVTSEGSWEIKKYQEAKIPALNAGEKLRFCIVEGNQASYVSLCTQWYTVHDLVGENKVTKKLEPSLTGLLPRVIVNGEEGKLVGRPKVQAKSTVQFFASLKSEATYEFLTSPRELEIKDLEELQSEDKFQIVGVAPAPFGIEAEEFDEIKYSKTIERIGFQDTVLPNQRRWIAKISKDQKSLFFPGVTGGVFEYSIAFSNVPTKTERYYLLKNALKSTYKEQHLVDVWDDQGNQKFWSLTAPNVYEQNRNFIEIDGKDSVKHRGYLEIYRARQSEASLSLASALAQDSGVIVFADLKATHWFEDLFGWRNPYLSEQRWGVGVKFFTALTDPIAVLGDGGKEATKLSLYDVDLRYRFTPGVWGREETLGAILRMEGGQIGRYDISNLGVGLFWARSMPKGIDDLFNKVEFLRHPKWVSAEFTNFMSSASSGIKLQSNWTLDLNSKVYFTPQLFGELGVGLKSYSFTVEGLEGKVNSQMIVGNVGIGMGF